MNPNLLLLAVAITAIIAFNVGRSSRNGEVGRMERSLSERSDQLVALQRLNAVTTATLQTKEQQLNIAEIKLAKLQSIYDGALRTLRKDSVLLPRLATWEMRFQKAKDEILVGELKAKKRPAPKAAESVREARREARIAKRDLRFATHRVDLFERLAPWLADYVDLSLDELLQGLREDQNEETGEDQRDPVLRFVPKTEWQGLSETDRNQLALERYCDPHRKRTPWAAGIQYERFIGHLYEKKGFNVGYFGATQGREDLGIDLICQKGHSIHTVQCKRLSPDKQIPVRENVIAQVFGAGRYYEMSRADEMKVLPVLFTTYKLSDQARDFAKFLSVRFFENYQMKPYPMIKCNISRRDGEKIYHLPMDQQYDKVRIGDQDGEFYASTVAEAEAQGFRRAFRWTGQDSGA